jgi:hypothetical protein
LTISEAAPRCPGIGGAHDTRCPGFNNTTVEDMTMTDTMKDGLADDTILSLSRADLRLITERVAGDAFAAGEAFAEARVQARLDALAAAFRSATERIRADAEVDG